uniref:Putative MULE transposase domain, FHY3/FAR1 family n=1 Tax=Helianthus annuus TaxID=4232 RepID=A0A251RPL7_HELAN
MSWYNYVFGEPSDANTSTFISDRSVAGSNVPGSYDLSGNDDHAHKVVSGYCPHHNESLLPDLNESAIPRQPLLPDLNACSHDQGYGSPYYEPDYVHSYEQEEYGNNVFVSGASGVQEDVVQPSCVQESLGDDPPVQELLGDEPPVQKSLGDETPAYPEVSYRTDQGFSQRMHYVTRRSKDHRVWLQCCRSGEHESKATVRKTGSKKCACPFMVIGRLDQSRRAWRIEYLNKNFNETHNHGPAEHLEGYAYARRLTPNEFRLVQELTDQDIQPHTILKAVTEQNPENKCVPQDIHNAHQKIRAAKFEKKPSPMQQLEQILQEKKMTYYIKAEPSTNVVQHVFFFVCMTSTNQTFCVAHAFLSNEQEATYVWVMERVRSMLHECMEARVILTDKDQTLINAYRKIFPGAHRYLCRFHILQNIMKHCKNSFNTQDWDAFISQWKTMCNFATEELYKYNVLNLQRHLINQQRTYVFDYLWNNWLSTSRQLFVSAWTNQTLTFFRTTTNRAEGAHAALKKQLTTLKCSMETLVKKWAPWY